MFSNGQRHVVRNIELDFSHEDFHMRGKGRDKVGDFRIDGEFNPENGRWIFRKKYFEGTGDIHENLGLLICSKLLCIAFFS